MFPFGRSPYASSYQSYDPYDQILLQQELQRRRQAEEYARRRQLEELNRRRAAQLEYARREAELQRRREAEELRRREMEIEARRRKLSEPSHPQGLRMGGPGSRHSMFDGGVQDLFDALYGRPHPRSPSPDTSGRRSVSTAPRAARERPSSVEPRTKVRFATEDVSIFPTFGELAVTNEVATQQSAVSDTEEPSNNSPDPNTMPDAASSTPDDAIDDSQNQQIDTSPSRKAVVDILSKFANLKSGFTFPATLDFLPPPEGVSAPAPKLAYTPNNAPLHQHEHLLTGLLTQLDAVESYGDAEVRKARKDAVKEIEKELEELDGRKVNEWRRQFEPEATVVEPISESTPDAVGTTQSTAPITEETSQNRMSVDPVSVPLPSDEDRELYTNDFPEPVATSSDPMVPDLSSAEPSLSQSSGDNNSQNSVAPSELAEPATQPAPLSVSIQDAELIQDVFMHAPSIDQPALEPRNNEATEDDYVHITPVKKVDKPNPVVRGPENEDDAKIKDDWELNF
ncbi:hypothetical protein FRC12_017189 [Ceratobasidium sp. 428]|nr:hypothetical protein FRC12_017189 [Ceratobasidium sp. 428]